MRAALPAAVLLLEGCAVGSPAPAQVQPGTHPLIPITHPHALRTCPDIPAVHFDHGLDDVVTVNRCIADFHEVQGVFNKVQYVQRARDDSGDLLEAYAAADEPPAESCTLEARDPLILWLELGSGETVVVRAPVDSCGMPQAQAAAAYDSADFETILVAREVASTLDDG